ncbi:MAG: hypothetical protein WC768_02740 [Patescibacteria group bacterium]|jgi:hypothetical protein
MFTRLSVIRETVKGPFAPSGEEVVFLRDSETGAKVTIQPDNGSDMIAIENPKGRSFRRRTVPGGVISPGNLAGMVGTLQTALMTIGANVTAIPTPGYAPFWHGLHMLLSIIPAEENSQKIDTNHADSVVSVQHRHKVSIANTDPRIACDLAITRRTTMAVCQSLGITIEQSDQVGAKTDCHISTLDHPNPLVEAGDQIILPWKKVAILQDRDGNTPDGANPFTVIDHRFLGQAVPERCFFAHIRPNDKYQIPLLLKNRDNSCGVGIVYDYLSRHPFVMIWYSPGGCCGLKYGDLPIGSDALYRLGMHELYTAGTALKKSFTIFLLNDEEAVRTFARRYQLDLAATGPTEISGCDENYVQLAEAAAATNTALRCRADSH